MHVLGDSWLACGFLGWRPLGILELRRGRVPIPILQAGAGHALAQAAVFDEVLLQTAELLVDQVIGLVDEAQGDIGHDFGRAGFQELAIVFVGLRSRATTPEQAEGAGVAV